MFLQFYINNNAVIFLLLSIHIYFNRLAYMYPHYRFNNSFREYIVLITWSIVPSNGGKIPGACKFQAGKCPIPEKSAFL